MTNEELNSLTAQAVNISMGACKGLYAGPGDWGVAVAKIAATLIEEASRNGEFRDALLEELKTHPKIDERA